MEHEQGPDVRHLSPSKIEKFVEKCPLSLKFELDDKAHGIPPSTSYYMIGGSAVHAVVEFALKEVLAGRPLPSAKDLHDRFPMEWDREIAERERKKEPIEEPEADDPPERIKRECHALVPVVREQALPKVRPKLVEYEFKEWVQSPAGPFIVWGRLDLMHEDLLVEDWKTTRETVSANQKKFGIQMMGYGWAAARMHPGAFDGKPVQTRKTFLIRGSHPRVEMTPLHPVESADRAFFERAAGWVWEATQKGIYVPHFGWWCSPDWCPAYAPCRGDI